MTSRLDHLTGLRGVAAYSVLFAHAASQPLLSAHYIPTAVLSSTQHLAYLGMSLFFVLSGFVIHHNYSGIFQLRPFAEACWHFFTARFARLYPLYALILVLATFIDPVLGRRLGTLVAYAFMTASWFNLEMLLYPPAWSVSTESFFYYAFALMAPFLWKIKRPMLWLVAALIVLPALFLAVSSWSGLEPLLQLLFWHDEKASAPVIGWFGYFSPYVRIGEFIFGMLASAVYFQWGERVPSRRAVVRSLEASAVAWCALLLVLSWFEIDPVGPLSYNYAFAPALVVIMLVGASEFSILGAMLRVRPILVAGEISYSLYLWYWLIFMKLDPVIKIETLPSLTGYLTAAGKTTALIVATTIVAYLSYHLYEWPMRRLLRTMLANPRQVADIWRAKSPRAAA
jgi:peptidoglycan/LPS O-acetylase OafA/YrhL